MGMKLIETVSIVGAGFMGAQIGLQCAVHGFQIWQVDISESELERASESQSKELQKRVENSQITKHEKKEILKKINFTTNLKIGVSRADIVIEAVHERLDLKRNIFLDVDGLCRDHTIITTNSSSICISRIEDATNRPDKVINTHFYVPVWQRPIVELMRGSATTDETVDTVRQFAHDIGMTPLMVKKESTGFIFNRVWRSIKKECLHLVDEGVSSFEDVDRAWMIVMEHPAGPFGIMDMIGLDVVKDIEMVYYEKSGDESDAPPKLLEDRIEKNELGVKTGKGFYTYPNPAFQDPSFIKGF